MNPRVVRPLAALLIVAAAAVCFKLGIWQLSRAGEKRAAHASRVSRLEQPPIEPGAGGVALEPGRRVELKGAWDRGVYVLLSGRTHLGAAGVQVVTPLVLASGERVLVERGWLAADDSRIAHPEHWDDGDAVVHGVAERYATSPRVFDWVALESERAGVALWSARALDSTQVIAHVTAPLANAYVRAWVAAGDTAAARVGLVAPPFAVPDSGEGVHMAYALQWFAIAVLIVLGGGVLMTRRLPVPPR